jgi:hypothetical protein
MEEYWELAAWKSRLMTQVANQVHRTKSGRPPNLYMTLTSQDTFAMTALPTESAHGSMLAANLIYTLKTARLVMRRLWRAGKSKATKSYGAVTKEPTSYETRTLLNFIIQILQFCDFEEKYWRGKAIQLVVVYCGPSEEKLTACTRLSITGLQQWWMISNTVPYLRGKVQRGGYSLGQEVLHQAKLSSRTPESFASKHSMVKR